MNETALLTFPRAHRSLPLINSSPRAWVEKKVRAQPLGSKLNMKVRYSLRPDRPVGKRMKMECVDSVGPAESLGKKRRFATCENSTIFPLSPSIMFGLMWAEPQRRVMSLRRLLE